MPRAVFIDPAAIDLAQQRLADKDPFITASWQALKSFADDSLERQPGAAENYAVPGYYGDNRAEHTRMKRLLDGDASAAYACAAVAVVGHGLSEEQRTRYAQHSANIVRNWSTTNKRVSEHDGRLVMCYNGTAFVFTTGLLRQLPVWTDADDRAMRSWVTEVLAPISSIRNRNNNWAAWGIFTSVACNALLDNEAGLSKDAERLQQIIDEQIEPDGSMPHEIKRGKRGIWYTYFGLAPLTAAIESLRVAGGPDLYHYQPPSKGTIENALDFLFEKGLANPTQWPDKRAHDEQSDWAEKHGAMYTAMGATFQREQWTKSAQAPSLRLQGGLAWMSAPLFLPKKSTLAK